MTRTAWVALAVGGVLLAVLLVVLPEFGSDEPGDPVDSAELAEVRAAAGLEPCPRADGTPVRSLSGVAATCLGSGARVDAGEVLGGELTLVNLWAPWCAPCREELPVLATYAQDADAVRVITVQVDSRPRDGLELLAELNVRLPGVHDGTGYGPIREALSTPNQLPASYVVDSGGDMRLIENPRVFTSVDDVRSAVERLLPEV